MVLGIWLDEDKDEQNAAKSSSDKEVCVSTRNDLSLRKFYVCQF